MPRAKRTDRANFTGEFIAGTLSLVTTCSTTWKSSGRHDFAKEDGNAPYIFHGQFVEGRLAKRGGIVRCRMHYSRGKSIPGFSSIAHVRRCFNKLMGIGNACDRLCVAKTWWWWWCWQRPWNIKRSGTECSTRACSPLPRTYTTALYTAPLFYRTAIYRHISWALMSPRV